MNIAIDPIGRVNELVAECSRSNFLSINNIADFLGNSNPIFAKQ